MRADQLLDDLAQLNPHKRVRRAVEVARGLAGQERRSLLTELGGGEPYCRHLAVTMAAATGASEHLVAALRDPYPAVRKQVLDAPGLPDDAIVELLADASWNDRLAVYALLRRRRRTGLADRLFPLVQQRWGDAEAGRLLSACSGAVVTDALPALGYAVPSWTLLTVVHPGAVVAYATAELAPLGTEARVGWWGRTGPLQRALALHQPAALLDLCERFLTGPVPWVVSAFLRRLLAVDPPRVARLLLADPSRPGQLARLRLTRSVRDRLATLPDADLGALLHASGPAPNLVATVLRGLPPARREAVFDLAYAERDLAAQVLPDEILTVLPHDRRHAEARRMLELPAVATDSTAVLRTAAFLPYGDAVALLDKASRSAEAEERAHAYESLVRCAARTGDPAAVSRLLAGLDRIRNEQDPVRSRLLAALAEVRPELFGVADIGALDGLVRDAFDARDCSWQTTQAVTRLVFRILWRSAATAEAQPLMEWALETVERISAWQHGSTTTNLSRMLRRGQEHEVFDRMRHWLTEALRRNEAWPLLTFARSLGKRAWQMPELQKLIGRAVRIKRDTVVTTAVSLWLAPPRGRAKKASRLVERDESMLTLPEVLSVVLRRRTGLVDDYVLAGRGPALGLDQQVGAWRPLRGRFGTGKAVWVPPVDGAALALCTPRQVDLYATLVQLGVHDEGLDPWRRALLARTLAGLPGPGPARVAELIAGDDVLIAEGALTGLAHSDRPDRALPVLLGNIRGDRARVAIFGAARCARYVAPSQLAAILRAALADEPKVTVRKEVARLLSQLRVPGAVDELVAAWHRPGQHRDVRVAVAAAVRTWLDDPRSWTVLEAAADAERHAAESLLDVTPYQLAERHRERYADLVRGLTRHPEPEVTRRAYAALAEWTRWAPGSAAEITSGVTDLAEGPTWRYAAACAANPAAWTVLPELLPELTAALLRLAGSDRDAEQLRDRPARQRLGYLVDSLSGRAEAARRDSAPVRRMVELLGADSTFVAYAGRLSAALLWPGPRFTDDLVALADLLADAPYAVSDLAGYYSGSEWEPAEVGPGVDRLAERGDAVGGRLAVALTDVAGERAGWPDSWRGRLRALRQHPEPQVRHAALAVFTAEE